MLRSLACGVALVPTLLLSNPLMAASIDDGHIQHVLLISVDGMHAVDLQRYVVTHPASALAALSANGATYANALCSSPSDSFPGLAALVTGGKPATVGLWYDDAFDRSLFAPGSSVPGTETNLSEALEWDNSYIDGGAKHFGATSMIDPSHLPRDAGGNPVFPHQILRVNTIFEVVKGAGLRTAWSDKHAAYEWVNGPSGTGVDDLFTPEINSFLDADGNPLTDGMGHVLPIPGPASPVGQGDITSSVAATEWYDGVKVAAVLNQIQGRSSTGALGVGVPAVFGMNFQSVSVGQKVANDPVGSSGPRGGYSDAAGTPNAPLASALDFVDGSLGQMMSALTGAGLRASTLIIVTAKHGQSPIDASTLRMLKPIPALGITGSVQDPVPQDDAGTYWVGSPASGIQAAFAIEDDASLIWLKDQSQTAAAVAVLQAEAGPCHIQSILSGPALVAEFSNPLSDPRVPDIIVQPIPGTVYAGIKKKYAEHGGASQDDRHVALLVANPGLTAQAISAPVDTRQVAPTIIKALGLDPHALQAVGKDATSVLGGLGLDDSAPPQRTVDLVATRAGEASVRLAWTAPVASGPGGKALAYDIRYSLAPITPDTFTVATRVAGAPVPAAGGTPQSLVVVGLVPSTTYYFAMRASDAGGATSAVSDVVSAETDRAGHGSEGFGARIPEDVRDLAELFSDFLGGPRYPAVLLVSRVHYAGNAFGSTEMYPTIFADPAISGIQGTVSIDRYIGAPDFPRLGTLLLPGITTSFSSKSEGALMASVDGGELTYMGYAGPVGAQGVSNSETPGAVLASNTAPTYDRLVARISANGAVALFPQSNAYSGDNPRAAISVDGEEFYMAGNADSSLNKDGSGPGTTIGARLAVPGSPLSQELGVYVAADRPDETAKQHIKDNNFRAIGIFNGNLYVAKGSGGNGDDGLFQVHRGTGDGLPTGTGNTITPLFGAPATDPVSGQPSPYTTFGFWFADAKTVYVADEGNLAFDATGNVLADPLAGLEKWQLIGGTWHLAYTLQAGLGLGKAETIPGYPVPTTTYGLRNLTGTVNPDGTVTVYAITAQYSSISGGEPDPTKLVAVSDVLAAPTLASARHGGGREGRREDADRLERFVTLQRAAVGEVFRGVAVSPHAFNDHHRHHRFLHGDG